MKQFLLILTLLLTAIQLSASEIRAKRVVLLQTMSVLPVLNHSREFVSHLENLGYMQGNNLDLTILNAEGERSKAEELLREELANGSVDLVVTSATLASQVAHKLLADSNIPQIFFTVSDPVGAGLVPVLNRPNENKITGKVHSVPRSTKIEMILRLLSIKTSSKPIRFGFIYSSYPSSVGDFHLLQEAATSIPEVEFIPFKVKYSAMEDGLDEMLTGVKAGIKELNGRIDYWFEPAGPLGETKEYTRVLRDSSNHPIIYGTNLESVRHGALIHITPQDAATGYEAAQLAVAILQGRFAGDFPVTAPKNVDLGINLATALKMGIVVPSDLVELAGKNLYLEQSP